MEFGLCVPHVYNPVEQEIMPGQFHASRQPGVLKNVNMNENILQRYTILPKVLGHPLLMKGLTTLVISMSTNLNV